MINWLGGASGGTGPDDFRGIKREPSGQKEKPPPDTPAGCCRGGKNMTVKFVMAGILVAAVVAFAASLGVEGVNLLGSGSADVKAQPVEVTSVDWELVSSNPTLVNSAHVTIRTTDGQTHTGDFFLTAKDSQGNVLAQQEVSNFTFNGTGTDVEFVWPSDISAEKLSEIALTVEPGTFS